MNTEPYTRLENNALVFAARYTHHRNTGATLLIRRCLMFNWERIDQATTKIIKPSIDGFREYTETLIVKNETTIQKILDWHKKMTISELNENFRIEIHIGHE
jgi:hypothetical protein